MQSNFAALTTDERVYVTQVTMSILDDWKVSSEDVIALLALPEGTALRAMRRYRENTPFPEDENVYMRVSHILAIAEALRTTFPRNAQMAPKWMRQKQRRFSQRTPLAIIMQDGLVGMIQIRCHLDCTYSWSEA